MKPMKPMKSIPFLTRLLVLALWLAGAAVSLAADAEVTARHYDLHTLDYRIAENLIWKICDRNGGKSDQCRVLRSEARSISVVASPEVHAQIVEMLAERDRIQPASLFFEIVLARLVDNGDDDSPGELAEHHRRALEALWEIFPGKRAEILDAGVIRTTSEGQIRLGTTDGESYEAQLALRSTVGGADGLVFTVDMSIFQRRAGGDSRILASSLSIGEGETVVAGSSRMGGEAAVVVLLTSKLAG